MAEIMHIHLPVQVLPSPAYPELQAHVKPPTVLVQVASALQSSLFVAHSSISTSQRIKYSNYRYILYILKINPLDNYSGFRHHVVRLYHG